MAPPGGEPGGELYGWTRLACRPGEEGEGEEGEEKEEVAWVWAGTGDRAGGGRGLEGGMLGKRATGGVERAGDAGGECKGAWDGCEKPE